MDSIAIGVSDDSAREEVKPEPLGQNTETELLEEGFSAGSKCRFRRRDGRWYDGRVLGIEDGSSARVSFLTPTSENMLVSFFLLLLINNEVQLLSSEFQEVEIPCIRPHGSPISCFLLGPPTL